MAVIDPSAVWDFAGEIVGRIVPSRAATTATVTRIDPDGTTWVTTGDGGEAPASGVAAGVSVGDTVTLEWDGSAMGIRSNVSDPAPSGSAIRRAVTRAQGVASAAQRVADAVNQHFFADGSGIHVTESTQDEWEASHTGANVLINSIGQLFRDGLNNLLTLTTENGARALTVWDGLGNTASHIRAIIGETITLGNASENHLELDGENLAFLDQDDNRLFYINPYDGEGIPENSFVRLSTDSGWFVVDGGGYAGIQVASDDVTINVKEGNATAGALYASGSEVRVYQPLYADAGMTATYQLLAEGRLNAIALRANTAGNRGLYDVTNDEWILYRDTNGNLVLGSLKQYTGSCTVDTSNATIAGNVNYCWKNDAVCTITITVNLKSSLSSGSVVTVATAPSGYRPPHAVMGQVYITGQSSAQLQAQISADGVIRLNNRSGSAVTTSANIYISFTFAP